MIYLVLFSVPLAILGIVVAKTVDKWLPVLQGMEQWQRVLFIGAFGMVIAYGGAKGPPPGPTKANLRLLLAQRVRLSNGMEYGRKEEAVTAEADADAAASAVAIAGSDTATASNTLATVAAQVQEANQEPRKYMRLHTPMPDIPDGTLYGEIADVSVDAGVAVAAVWFNVVPASVPAMRFSFALRSATNRWRTVAAEQCSWPDTFDVFGYDCYLFYFACPPELLNPDGTVIAPLYNAQEIGWGSPETGEPFDMRGGVAFEIDGELWETVTGTRTNAAGEEFYFDGGRLADPSTLTQEVPDAM
jgi:hypothetical protein